MAIKITAKRPGFRRAGLAHYGTVVYPDDYFTLEQLAALKAENNLVVEEVSQEQAERDISNPPASAAPDTSTPADDPGADGPPASAGDAGQAKGNATPGPGATPLAKGKK